ncbi:MAG TPA: hypothetical protein VF678_05640 [bacterium]
MARFSLWLRIVIGVATALQVVLGFYVWWSGNMALLPVHILLGLVIIGALWVATLLASRVQVGFARCIAVVALTLALPLLGMAQIFVPAGPGNWALLVLHLGVAGAAIGIATRLTRLAQDQFTRGAGITPSGSPRHVRA